MTVFAFMFPDIKTFRQAYLLQLRQDPHYRPVRHQELKRAQVWPVIVILDSVIDDDGAIRMASDRHLIPRRTAAAEAEHAKS